MGVQQEKGRQFAHYRGAYQSWAEITIIRILLEVRWIAEVHAFGRFFKVGVEGQQWQMPGLRAQDKPRHKGSAAAHARVARSCRCPMTIEAAVQFLQECCSTPREKQAGEG
jgi:hypothetical protein